MLFWMIATALAGPLQVDLTASEEALVSAGEVVVRAPDDSGLLIGAVDISAGRAAIWDAVLDFDARVENVSAVRAIDIYAQPTDPGGLGTRYELSIMGMKIVYHLRYELDPAQAWCTFALDPAKTNDLASSSGGYHILPAKAGVHRLVYWATTDAGRAVPGFVRNSLSIRSIRNQLDAMRALATAKP